MTELGRRCVLFFRERGKPRALLAANGASPARFLPRTGQAPRAVPEMAAGEEQ
jgi:hypothetical protein